uniref:Uncharacterized protein n=1 Tax=Acrobeloides nanus TaxID=290746 RepID=A0A914C1D3_9BILA
MDLLNYETLVKLVELLGSKIKVHILKIKCFERFDNSQTNDQLFKYNYLLSSTTSKLITAEEVEFIITHQQFDYISNNPDCFNFLNSSKLSLTLKKHQIQSSSFNWSLYLNHESVFYQKETLDYGFATVENDFIRTVLKVFKFVGSSQMFKRTIFQLEKNVILEGLRYLNEEFELSQEYEEDNRFMVKKYLVPKRDKKENLGITIKRCLQEDGEDPFIYSNFVIFEAV